MRQTVKFGKQYRKRCWSISTAIIEDSFLRAKIKTRNPIFVFRHTQRPSAKAKDNIIATRSISTDNKIRHVSNR